MRRERNRLLRLAHALVCSLLPLCAAAGGQAAMTLAELEAAFAASYVPGSALQAVTEQLAALDTQLDYDSFPSFTLRERLEWRRSSGLSLDLDLSAVMPLYRSLDAPNRALQSQRWATLTLEQAVAAAEARTEFVRTVLLLAAFSELEAEAGAALGRIAETGWRQPADVSAAFAAAPDEREMIGLVRNVAGLHAYARTNSRLLAEQVARDLAVGAGGDPVATATLLLPPLATLLAELGTPDMDAAACLAASPFAELARARHEEQLIDWHVRGAPDLRVELHAGGAYRHGAFSGTVRLEARLPLPPTLPVTGQLSAGLTPTGADQALSVTWPPRLDPFHLAGDVPHAAAEKLEAELTHLERDIDGLSRALANAADDIGTAQLKLLWFVRDVLGLADLEEARAAAHRPAADPVVELQLVGLRADLTFARLAHAEAALDLALLCGERGGA